MSIQQSLFRLAGITAIVIALLMPSGLTAAAQTEVGLIGCSQDSCNVVTVDDLKAARAGRELTVYRQMQLPTDPYSPHFTP